MSTDELDDLLDPANGKDAAKSSKKDEEEKTMSKLKSLKEQLLYDDTNFDSKKFLADTSQFPQSQSIQDIDYEKEENKHREYASGVINDIILNYVKSDKLLESLKLKRIKQSHIDKLAELMLLVDMSKNKLVLINESIDGGDFSKEMFDLSDKYNVTMGKNIEARSKHIDACEVYWKNYASTLNLEVEEENIASEIDSKSENKDDNRIITDSKSINDLIWKQMEKAKKDLNSGDNNENA